MSAENVGNDVLRVTLVIPSGFISSYFLTHEDFNRHGQL